MFRQLCSCHHQCIISTDDDSSIAASMYCIAVKTFGHYLSLIVAIVKLLQS